MNIIINGQDYVLTKAPIIGLKKVEIHFDEFQPDIDFSHGFIIYSGDPSNIIENCLDYTKKWNVLTELEDGIVLTNTNEVETEDNRLEPYPEFIDEPIEEVPSLEERIRDLEAAICELAEGM